MLVDQRLDRDGDSLDKKVTIHWRSDGDNSWREQRVGDGGGEGDLFNFNGVEERGDEGRENCKCEGEGNN